MACVNQFHEVLVKFGINILSRKEIDFVPRLFIKAIRAHLLETPCTDNFSRTLQSVLSTDTHFLTILSVSHFK